MEPYFSAPENTQLLMNAANTLMIGSPGSLKYRLGHALRIIAKNPQNFDKNCEVNIEWMGRRFIDRVSEVRLESSESDLEPLTSVTYRIVREFQFSIKEDLSTELFSFLTIVDQFYTISVQRHSSKLIMLVKKCRSPFLNILSIQTSMGL
jgi:hypothetical protein